ncbi:MAG: Undecaprenyl-diphosphatase [Ilumatobacteraceae bacterium]|nr:Undecaprenyl-diphosphatase [Ilumatobacteraceae bacterium]
MDDRIFRAVNRFADRTAWLHGLFTANAGYGIVLFAVLLLVAYLDARHRGDVRAVAGTVWAALAALAALGIGQIIGGAVDRARPITQLSGVHLLVDRTNDFSFPSDHATVAGAVAMGLLLVDRRWGIIGWVLAVLMAFTRVYVGAHFPSDVLAGLALGAVVAVAGRFLVVPLLVRIAERLRRSPFGVLVSSRPTLSTADA